MTLLQHPTHTAVRSRHEVPAGALGRHTPMFGVLVLGSALHGMAVASDGAGRNPARGDGGGRCARIPAALVACLSETADHRFQVAGLDPVVHAVRASLRTETAGQLPVARLLMRLQGDWIAYGRCVSIAKAAAPDRCTRAWHATAAQASLWQLGQREHCVHRVALVGAKGESMISLVSLVEAGPPDASRSAVAVYHQHGPAWATHVADKAARRGLRQLVNAVASQHAAAMQHVDRRALIEALHAISSLDLLRDGVLQVRRTHGCYTTQVLQSCPLRQLTRAFSCSTHSYESPAAHTHMMHHA